MNYQNILIKFKKYYKVNKERYQNIRFSLLNKLSEVTEEEIAKARSYLDGILNCIIEKELIKEFPISVDKILNVLGYELFYVNMKHYKFSKNENTVAVLGEDKNNKKIFITNNENYQEMVFVALAMCLGDYLINQGSESKKPFFTGCILDEKNRLLLNISRDITLLDELCYEFALRLLIPKEIYVRLNAIVTSAGIKPENEAIVFAQVFSVRKEDFLNRIKLEESKGFLYE